MLAVQLLPHGLSSVAGFVIVSDNLALSELVPGMGSVTLVGFGGDLRRSSMIFRCAAILALLGFLKFTLFLRLL